VALLLLVVIGLLGVVCLLRLLLLGGGGGGGGDMGVSGLPCPVAGAAALALSLASMVMLAWLSLSDAPDSPSASAGCWVLLERWKPQAPSRVRWLFPLAANSGALLAGPPRGRPAPGRAPPCAALDAMLRGVGSAHRTSRALIYFGSNRSIQ